MRIGVSRLATLRPVPARKRARDLPLEKQVEEGLGKAALLSSSGIDRVGCLNAEDHGRQGDEVRLGVGRAPSCEREASAEISTMLGDWMAAFDPRKSLLAE